MSRVIATRLTSYEKKRKTYCGGIATLTLRMVIQQKKILWILVRSEAALLRS